MSILFVSQTRATDRIPSTGCCAERNRLAREHAWADAPRVRIDVLVGNAGAIAFWRAVGFRDYCLTMESEESPATTR